MGNVGRGPDGDGHQQHRERLWASPHCLQPDSAAPELDLWAAT